jgi:transposase
MGNRDRRGYPTDVTEEEWSFVAPYLALCREDAEQRGYPLRSVFNARRYVAKTGCHWRMLPNDLPPWNVVYKQMRRWIDARCFETMVEDLRIHLREYAGRKGHPTAVVIDSRTPLSGVKLIFRSTTTKIPDCR